MVPDGRPHHGQAEHATGTVPATKKLRAEPLELLCGCWRQELPPAPELVLVQAEHLPLWVGQEPEFALTPALVDELHHRLYTAWKDRQDFSAMLQAAQRLMNPTFACMNPHNFAITVGLTAEALYQTGADPLQCANTVLYGLDLLRAHPDKQSMISMFCRDSCTRFMDVWADTAFLHTHSPTASLTHVHTRATPTAVAHDERAGVAGGRGERGSCGGPTERVNGCHSPEQGDAVLVGGPSNDIYADSYSGRHPECGAGGCDGAAGDGDGGAICGYSGDVQGTGDHGANHDGSPRAAEQGSIHAKRRIIGGADSTGSGALARMPTARKRARGTDSQAQPCGDPPTVAMRHGLSMSPKDLDVVERLLRVCDTFPHCGLPDVLAKRLARAASDLLSLHTTATDAQALTLLHGVLQSPWATSPHHRAFMDADTYWRLMLLEYIASWRHAQVMRPLAHGSPPPHVVRMVVCVVPSSSGCLPTTYDDIEHVQECGYSTSNDTIDEVLKEVTSAFHVFAESYLALTEGAIQWEMVHKGQHVLRGSTMPARAFVRQPDGPTTPRRVVCQPALDQCRDFVSLLNDTQDHDVRTAKAVLVVWPGLQAPSSYMCTMGGVAVKEWPGRFIYISDGLMLDQRPRWSPEWFHHETFHVMEQLFPGVYEWPAGVLAASGQDDPPLLRSRRLAE